MAERLADSRESPREHRRDWRVWLDALYITALVAGVWWMYRAAFDLWWLYDDAFHLRLVSTKGLGAFFSSPSFWRSLPNPVFTPLLFASWQLDLTLFGPVAPRFYAHHLIAMSAVAAAIYALCRLWLEPLRSGAAAFLTVAGPPVAAVAQRMFHRHYVEGLVLAVVATVLFVLAVRRNQQLLSVAAAVFYLASMAAKEVYVPLILILPAVPERSIRERVRHLVPFAAAAVLYAVWRTLLLGPNFTGYGWAVTPAGWWKLIGTLPVRALWSIVGADKRLGTPLLVLIVLVLILLLRARRARSIAFAAFIGAFLPIIPVSFEMEARFLLVAWVFVALAATFATRETRGGAALVVAILVIAFLANRAEWNSLLAQSRRMSNEGRAVGELAAHDVILDPETPPAAMAELRWLHQSLLGDHETASWLYDELPLCSGGISDARVYIYRGEALRHAPAALIQSLCRRIVDMPMETRFAYRDAALWWNLDAPGEGDFKIVLGGGSQAFAVPPEGGFRLSGPAPLPLRVRYESSQGWVTYSPELAVPLREGSQVQWRR
jgi:hypothetical protein